ncbi:MAG: HAD family hydrolase [Chloroflexi bacterium]|nr:HAD family hydrolase [Chloroflexota bacterium]
MTTIRAVFFDLGKTLIYPKDSWQSVFLRANKALAQSLHLQEIPIDLRSFPYEFAECLNQYYVDRETTLRETTTFRMLQQLVTEKGFPDAPVSKLRIALDAFYGTTQQNWLIEEDAHAALRALKLNGYKLALLSNAGNNSDVQTLVDKNNLRHYFSFIRTSAKCGYRKPHRHIFDEAINELGVFPEQCAMVGDTLDADIKGANALNIYSIWINRRVNQNTKTLVDIRPKAVIQELIELPKLLLEIP